MNKIFQIGSPDLAVFFVWENCVSPSFFIPLKIQCIVKHQNIFLKLFQHVMCHIILKYCNKKEVFICYNKFIFSCIPFHIGKSITVLLTVLEKKHVVHY